jgi:hypothetical protein
LAEVRSGQSTRWATAAPQPTPARQPDQGAAKQHAAGAKREVVERGLTARGICLAAFQDSGIEHQEKALRGKGRRHSQSSSDEPIALFV